MGDFILLLHQVRSVLQVALGVALGIGALMALAAWLERTRRVSPFGVVARFARRAADPLLQPVDRVVARLGGTRRATPWWGLFALLVLGTALLGVVDFVRGLLTGAYYASSQGPRGLLRLAVSWTFGVLQLAVLVRVVTSWVGGQYSWIGRSARSLTEWFLAPLRRALPTIGMVDISPLVAWFALTLLRGIIVAAL